MYRNIVYKVGPDTGWNGEIVLYTWDDDGNPVEKVYPHRSKLYFESPKGKYNSMFGTKLEVKYFSSVINRSRWIKNNPGMRIFESLPPEREFLMEMFEGQQEDDDFMKYDLRTHFIDIEVAIEDEFPLQDEVKYPINVICVYDNHLNEYHMWVLRNKKWCSKDQEFPDYDDTVHHVFDDEYKMLHHFVSWFKRNRPDVLTGWNVEDFDIPYLVNRIELFLGETVNLLSPVGEIRKELREQRGYDTRKLFSYKIVGVSVLDYMLMYKHKFLNNLPNYKLDTVAQHELGVGKLEYEGTFKQFYRSNFVKFVKYNKIDVQRVVEIDAKKKYITLARKICNFGLVEYQAIFRSSPYILGAITLQAHSMDMKIMTHSGEEQVQSSFVGAYVFPVKAGSYYNGIASFDLNSLYPSIMINLNISPETKIGKVIDKDNEEGNLVIRMVNGDLRKIDMDELESMRGKATLSTNGILYINPEVQEGIIPSFLKRLYKLRKSTKDKCARLIKKRVKLEEAMKGIKHEGTQLAKLQDTLKELKILIQNLDNRQHAFKIFLNSIYGQMGNAYFPLFDLDNASAVTLSGQKIIKESAMFMKEYIVKNYQCPDDPVVAGDTDSLYFDCEQVVKNLLGDNPKWNKTNVNKICTYIDENIVQQINDNCDRITHDEFMSPIQNIRFKREKFCTEALFLAKKRNILHARDDEGEYLEADDPKSWKCTGVDIKKNELPEKIKDCLRHIIFTSLTERWDSQRYSQEINDIWENFTSIPPEDIAFNKGYNTEKNEDGFFRVQRGAQAHARAVIYYNDLIEKLDLLHKYDKIPVGNVMRYVHVNKNNPYGIDVIAWDGDWPEEFDQIFKIDYKTMFSKVVLSPLKRIIEINNWPKRHPALQVVSDIMDL
jgi:DNA polymerase elongation subunit (family B)